eukprot:2181228-Alexandrium_andersonii.AAC.1
MQESAPALTLALGRSSPGNPRTPGGRDWPGQAYDAGKRPGSKEEAGPQQANAERERGLPV